MISYSRPLAELPSNYDCLQCEKLLLVYGIKKAKELDFRKINGLRRKEASNFNKPNQVNNAPIYHLINNNVCRFLAQRISVLVICIKNKQHKKDWFCLSEVA